MGTRPREQAKGRVGKACQVDVCGVHGARSTASAVERGGMKKVRIAGYAGALLLLCGLALLLWKWPDLKARAEAGAAYGARIACSCRYVENRSMESCEGDMEPGDRKSNRLNSVTNAHLV